MNIKNSPILETMSEDEIYNKVLDSDLQKVSKNIIINW